MTYQHHALEYAQITSYRLLHSSAQIIITYLLTWFFGSWLKAYLTLLARWSEQKFINKDLQIGDFPSKIVSYTYQRF